MTLELQQHPSFTGRPGPLLLVIADGVGVAPPGPSNAVHVADTPRLDALAESELYAEIAAHGPAVGLPSDDDMGNSEVGHNALGAGRVFAQGAKLVNRAIETGAIFETEAWKQIVHRATDGTLHLLGLHSDGNVHSHVEHLYALLRRADEDGVPSVAVHILHDGRDVDARSALRYIARTEAVLAEINESVGRNYRIGSGGGRMKITMDRYGADWPMVERGYRCHAFGEGRPFASANDAVETMYAEADAAGKDTGDQNLADFVVVDDDGVPVGTIADGDAVVMFNFRGDRAIEISQTFDDAEFDHFVRDGDGRSRPDVFYAGMLEYDGDLHVPSNFLVDPPEIDRTISHYLCAEGVRSFAVSETQKYGHVTYFWNGNRSGYIDRGLEHYVEIPSDNVEFDETPAMKVREITAEVIDLLRSGEYRFGRLNFPSGDMVGHTGNLGATVEAMAVIDECVAELATVIEELDGVMVFTADHGNADIMYTENAEGERSPKTSHTLSPVPFAIYDPDYDGEYHMAAPADAGLANVAATLLNLLGFEAPADYRQSLIEF